MIIVHLMTQDDQPHGSERRCCERCGVQILYRPDPPTWTDSRALYNALPAGHLPCMGLRAALTLKATLDRNDG